jgi:hypothetical protein
MHPAKNLTAFAADDYLSKDMVAAKGSGLAVRACVYNTAADKLFLHLHENFTRDNSLETGRQSGDKSSSWLAVFSGIAIRFTLFSKE